MNCFGSVRDYYIFNFFHTTVYVDKIKSTDNGDFNTPSTWGIIIFISFSYQVYFTGTGLPSALQHKTTP